MNRLQVLIRSYLQDRATDDEVTEMLVLLRTEPKENVMSLLESSVADDDSLPAKTVVDWHAMWAAIEMEMDAEKNLVQTPVRSVWQNRKRWFSFAAILLLLITGGYWISVQVEKKETLAKTTSVAKEILPGTTGAVLTLPDGKIIVLDTASNGLLAASGGTSFVKGSGGVMVAAGGSSTVAYATLATNMQRTQTITLADSTRVWLNAGSSIYFPLAFTGKDRRVTITGEVYFEVAENKTKPFYVKVGDAEIKVLGTHFNINAYADEKFVKTTLLTGSIALTKGSLSGLLKPGQQASFAPGIANLMITDESAASDAIAWVHGFFHFEKADIHTVMRQIARWYDVEVVYQGNVTVDRFGGDLQRNLPLSAILKALEKSQVHFKIEDRKLIVLP